MWSLLFSGIDHFGQRKAAGAVLCLQNGFKNLPLGQTVCPSAISAWWANHPTLIRDTLRQVK